MTNEQINTAIAEACGWRKEDGVYMWTAHGIDCTCPELWDWCNDLNAMHEAENTLTVEQWEDYVEHVGGTWEHAMHAPARQRAEAFLRALGKWEKHNLLRQKSCSAISFETALCLVKTGPHAMRLPHWGPDEAIELWVCPTDKRKNKLRWCAVPDESVSLHGKELLSEEWEVWIIK